MTNDNWKLHEDYIEQNYDLLDKLNPFLHGEFIREQEKKFDQNAVVKFKVTKLERGGMDDHKDFKPRQNPYGVDTRNMGKKKTEAQILKENETILRSREEKFLADASEDS